MHFWFCLLNFCLLKERKWLLIDAEDDSGGWVHVIYLQPSYLLHTQERLEFRIPFCILFLTGILVNQKKGRRKTGCINDCNFQKTFFFKGKPSSSFCWYI